MFSLLIKASWSSLPAPKERDGCPKAFPLQLGGSVRHWPDKSLEMREKVEQYLAYPNGPRVRREVGSRVARAVRGGVFLSESWRL